MSQSKKEDGQLEGLVHQVSRIDKILIEKKASIPEEAFAVIKGTADAIVDYANMGNIPLAFALMESVHTYFRRYLG